jgi:dipeptidyl-peptidase III
MIGTSSENQNNSVQSMESDFIMEQFADIRILRYPVPGFEQLSLKQKELIYYLSEAALCGRDIIYDQNGKYNLIVRKILENIYQSYPGDKLCDDWKNFVVYLKKIWFSNGIYDHYSSDKIVPEFSKDYFLHLTQSSKIDEFPLIKDKTRNETIEILIPLMFDKELFPKKVSQDSGSDIVKTSAVNFYGENISQKEVEDFYTALRIPGDKAPVSYGLNSKLVKEGNTLKEHYWKIGGMYSAVLEKIVFWLEKAKKVAETHEQSMGIEKLVEYYKTGKLSTWDEYNIVWLKDMDSSVDFVNGFIEVYSDPMGIKGSWESIVNFKDIQATKRTQIISDNAQWFEDNSPVDERFKKNKVKGVSAKVINIAMLGGDCYPTTPIGINLPNADWIRKEHGSKSVTLENITYAYAQADLVSGILEEFSASSADIEIEKKYGALASNIHTDLHECLGHGSGQMLPGISTEVLKNYHSPLEETRADLFALYYMLDPRMTELGLLPTPDAAKAHYISYIRNGLMLQLRRIKAGKNIEQAHMRNRQLIASWCYEKGLPEKVIEKYKVDNKTYIRINDFDKLRELFGKLLYEVQRIKSEGDYEAGRNLVESYGVKVDQEIHNEVLDRFTKLKLASFSGFVNPVYRVENSGDTITGIKIESAESYTEQMLYYSRFYSYL